ncbi:FtsX-like permease family protein [Paeniclostridium sordellii]|uniref:FtsX-like permease family protein n=1 Tax=Paraclostridium sordellii TaxID=1505 RepID=UPI00214A8B35|nr:FtsX-like permease family protein [Paeniclostridium sordellii]MCR1847990.1 FtsX-like permease family protein [Paeniclostridium sordellii]
MLFKLSFENIKKSFKDYAIYFLTLILGIAIFYVFNSLEKQTVMLNLSKSSSNSITIITTVLSVISVFVSFVLGFLIIYANRFLMKRRKREFGIYMTLGMGKKNISQIIFFETVLIGIISLIIGLIFGIGLSQVMSIFVANLFEADMDKFRFAISNVAILKTIVYFFIIYVFVMIFNIIQVSRCKLIDLIQSKSKSEEIKMKNPYVCIIVFIFAVILLFYAYYNVTVNAINIEKAIDVYLQIVYGVVGTFLVFWSLSGFIMKLIMYIDKFYYKNLNSFTLRQLSSKINTTVVSMSVICLMLFITICVFSSSVSMNATLKSNMRKLAKADISISNKINLEKINKDEHIFTKAQIDTSKLSIEEVLENRGFDINSNLNDIVIINKYQTKEVTLKDLLGKYYEMLKAENPEQVKSDEDFYSMKSDLVRVSDYNKIAKLYGKETYDLKNDEYMVICDYKNMIKMYNEGLKSRSEITIKGKSYKPKYEEIKDGYITMSPESNNTGIVLIPDYVVDKNMCTDQILAGNYKANDKQGKEQIEDKINKIRKEIYEKQLCLSISSKIDIYNDNIGTSAMAIFIGLYIGIVFLISSGAILALKELSESADSKDRYKTLRRLGIDEGMINKSLFVQIGIFFGFPLLLGIIHSIFGIQVANMMLESFGRDGLMKSIIMTSIFVVVIYGGYFIMTYLCSKNIIKED